MRDRSPPSCWSLHPVTSLALGVLFPSPRCPSPTLLSHCCNLPPAPPGRVPRQPPCPGPERSLWLPALFEQQPETVSDTSLLRALSYCLSPRWRCGFVFLFGHPHCCSRRASAVRWVTVAPRVCTSVHRDPAELCPHCACSHSRDPRDVFLHPHFPNEDTKA